MVDIHFQASQCLVGPVKERKERGGMISCFPCPARAMFLSLHREEMCVKLKVREVLWPLVLG